MKTLNVKKLNEKFGTNEEGEEIGYGERGIQFEEVECEDLADFAENADFGQCWTDDNSTTFYKVNVNDDAFVFIFDEDGQIKIL